MTLIHISTPADWQTAQTNGEYTAASLFSEGFIHCSFIHQTAATANRHFPGTRGLILLVLDENRLTARLVHENTTGGSELFPHIYGPINLDAVRAVLPFEPDTEGRFSLPAELAGDAA